ncbi:MAG TPA: phosphatidylinositol mannoside acyltransferase [Actinomycetota bacterium]|nr:phosphatidylinositol mannoside acyltransferase [Actinomycetota bacterium]
MPADKGKRHPAYLLYSAGRILASAVPGPVLLPGAEVAAALAGRLNKRRQEVIRTNLRRVVGPEQLDRAVDRAFRSYGRYWVETLRLPKPGVRSIAGRTSEEGAEKLEPYLRSGRGVIFVTPHLGNWDIAGAWLASRGWRVIAVAEALKPRVLFDMFVRLRSECGMEVHPLGTASTARALITGLKQGAALGLLSDRDISGTGVEVEFFGERTFLPSGPAVLALRTGAAIVAGAVFQRPGGRYHGVILDPIDVQRSRGGTSEVAALTQRIARELETLIRMDPGQWHLFQPNWPSDPGYSRTPG